MDKTLTLNDLKIEKANEKDWNPILELLEETGLTFWMTGKEEYSDYYVVKDPSTQNLICCFGIVANQDKVGILKSVAVRKNLQGKGIGKHIMSQVPDICKQLKIKTLYAVTDIPDFWRKTFLKEIKHSEIEDSILIDYINCVKDRVPDYFAIAYFFMYKF